MTIEGESERIEKTNRWAHRAQRTPTLCGSTSKTRGASRRNYSTTIASRTTRCEHYMRLNNSPGATRLLSLSSAKRIQESHTSDKAGFRLNRIDELTEDGSLGHRQLTSRANQHCTKLNLNHNHHHHHHHHKHHQVHKTKQRFVGASCSPRVRSKMLRLIRWPLVHLCLPLCLTNLMIILLLALIVNGGIGEQQLLRPVECSPTGTSAAISPLPGGEHRNLEPTTSGQHRNLDPIGLNLPLSRPASGINQNRASSGGWFSNGGRARRSLLMPINELRVSGSKLEPPSRPSQDWSKQRPYFGTNIQRNISVELGKTAHLTCKVFELGDKTVSWLRPRENEILTAGKYTYIGDSRVGSMNEQGSPDWILEIKDVGLNDSASYECQVSTDPKMSTIINLHVQAARAKIRQGENNYYPVGANIEFSCEVLPPPSSSSSHSGHLARSSTSSFYPMSGSGSPSNMHLDNNSQQQQQQIYWYHNGNLINYATASGAELSSRHSKFAIDWDQASQTSRLKLASIQLSDSGNYTCKPTSAEPATVRLFVKKTRASVSNRVHYSGGAQPKEAAQSTRQHYGLDLLEVSSASVRRAPISSSSSTLFATLFSGICLLFLVSL